MYEKAKDFGFYVAELDLLSGCLNEATIQSTIKVWGVVAQQLFMYRVNYFLFADYDVDGLLRIPA
jgi:hypothetical protein